jgi:hypothetical protein
VQLSYGRIPWINDPVFLAKWTTFINAVAARYDGKVDYIAMGGLGRVIESGIGARPDDIKALDALGGLAGWETAVKGDHRCARRSLPPDCVYFHRLEALPKSRWPRLARAGARLAGAEISETLRNHELLAQRAFRHRLFA